MDKQFMKGCEAIAESAIRAGCRFFAGYPITPQNELPEYMSRKMPEVGGVFVQGESEIASVNMVLGAAATGTRCMTSSSSPGISLKSEGISYIAGSRLPAVIVSVMRGGPGLGSIQPAQQDYNQAVKASGHGGFRMLVFAPANLQEAVDLTYKAFDYADRDRNPVMILIDGCIGAIMEPVILPEARKNLPSKRDWIIDGCENRKPRTITSLVLHEEDLEKMNIKATEMYETWQQHDVQVDEFMIDDAEVIIAAYGTSARIAKTAISQLRKEGIKVGLIRPITLFPFPYNSFEKLDYTRVKKVISVEMSFPAQMVEDVRLGVRCRATVTSMGRSAGIVLQDHEVVEAVRRLVKEEVE